MSSLETTRGDEIRFTVPVTQQDGTTPINLSYAQQTLWFTVRQRASDADPPVLEADSKNSGAGSGTGTITFVPGGGSNVATVRVPREQTVNLPAPAALVWDLQIHDGSSRWTLDSGVLIVKPEITTAVA